MAASSKSRYFHQKLANVSKRKKPVKLDLGEKFSVKLKNLSLVLLSQAIILCQFNLLKGTFFGVYYALPICWLDVLVDSLKMTVQCSVTLNKQVKISPFDLWSYNFDSNENNFNDKITLTFYYLCKVDLGFSWLISIKKNITRITLKNFLYICSGNSTVIHQPPAVLLLYQRKVMTWHQTHT